MSYLPFAWIGAAVFAAAISAPLLAPGMAGTLSLALGGLAFGALMAGILCGHIGDRGRRRAARFILFHCSLLLMSAGLFLALYFYKYAVKVAPALSLDRLAAEVLMEPLDYPAQRHGKLYYPVRILEINGRAVAPFQVSLTCSEALSCEPMDRVLLDLQFYSFASGGLFSPSSSRLAEGSVLGAYPLGYEDYSYARSQDSMPPGRALPALRRYCARLLERCLPGEEAGLLQAALLGQRWRLPESIQTDFRLTGSSHMLSVSGMHMTMVGTFLRMFLDLTPLPRRLGTVSAVFILAAYLTLTGFPLSALRSFIMFTVCSLGQISRQMPEALNSLGFSVAAICLFDPFSGGSAGFALSALATAGIVLLSRPLADRLCPVYRGPVLHWAAGTASASVSAAVFTLPVQTALFRGLPLLSLLCNLLLLPLFSAALYSALPLLVLSILSPYGPLVQPFALICGLLCRLVLKLSRLLAGIPGIYLSLTNPAAGLSLMLLLTALALCLLKRLYFRPCIIVLLLALAVFVPIYEAGHRQGRITLAVSGDGESTCLVLIQGRRAAVLSMGTFNSGLARQIITQENVRSLESILVTGGGYSSKSMARDLLENYTPNTLWLSGPAGKDLRYPGVTLRELPPDGTYQALPGAWVQYAGDTLRIWANGKKLILSEDGTLSESCSLLITGSPMPRIDTGLTLFMCGEGTSPGEAAYSVYSDFALVTGQSVTYADISPGGTISLRAF